MVVDAQMARERWTKVLLKVLTCPATVRTFSALEERNKAGEDIKFCSFSQMTVGKERFLE